MNKPLAGAGWFALGLAFLTPVFAMEKNAASASEYFVYFGTYTGPKSKGIYVSRFDARTGRASPAAVAAEADTPAFLAAHPGGKFLYAIDEGAHPGRKPGRGVSAYAIDAATGRLTLLNHESSGGEAPCHLSIDATGRSLVVANYTSGSVASLPVRPDGRLGPLQSLLSHQGSSVHPSRQKQPYAHCFTLSPDERFAFSADLGIDRIVGYRHEAATATLSPAAAPAASVPPGSGPRHLAFHPNGRFVYVINELLCTMSVFSYEPARGELNPLQLVSTLPAGVAVRPEFTTAEVAVHPNGRFVYGSNRGHDTIVVFAVEGSTGKLTPVQHQSTRGKTPRHFALDPAGAWLLAENQDSDTVAVFRVDGVSGQLTAVGEPLAVPTPVCAVFVRAN